MARIVALLALTAVCGSSVGARLIRFHAQLPEHPAGCHAHGHGTPAPRSTSYQCCLTGHNSAVPQASQLPEPILHNLDSKLLIYSAVKSLVAGDWEKLTVSSGDPPGATPLRI